MLSRSLPLPLPLTLVALAACHGGASVGGAAASSYLLVDAEARQAGWQVELADGWVGAPLLPIELRAGERVTLRGLGARVPVEAEAGALGWLRGATARLEWLDADGGAADRLIVDGTDDAVRALAAQVEGRATPRDDGRWTLEAPGLFGRTSFLDAPGLRDAQPMSGLAASHPARALVGGAVLDGTALAGPLLVDPVAGGASDTALGLVGAYQGAAGLLILDGAGGWRLARCGGEPLAGTWRADAGYVRLDGADGALPTLAIRGETLVGGEGLLFAPLSDETIPVDAATAARTDDSTLDL
jgi:hypothetical protein